MSTRVTLTSERHVIEKQKIRALSAQFEVELRGAQERLRDVAAYEGLARALWVLDTNLFLASLLTSQNAGLSSSLCHVHNHPPFTGPCELRMVIQRNDDVGPDAVSCW